MTHILKSILSVGIALALLMVASTGYALDTVRIIKGQSSKDVRINYKYSLLRTALEKTVDEFGPFSIDATHPAVSREHLLIQMQNGDLDLCFTPANPQWEELTLPIYIPIRKGLLNYRLLLVNKQHLDDFKSVETAADLKQFKVGLRKQWITTLLMKAQGFTAVEAYGYDGVFSMLNDGKSDFVPRGVNEIFGEIEVRKDKLINLAIEPRLAIYLPMPVYMYVSPKKTRLKRRIEKGLEAMVADGSFNALFMEYYGESIKQAQLEDRHIIQLSNPFMSEATPFHRTELWFDPLSSH